MTKDAIDLLIRQHPGLKVVRPKLEAMQPGAYCIHRSWGIGKIREYDDKENKLIIDFEEDDKNGHAMDPAFCVDKLEILPLDNILVRQRKEPGAIEEIAKKQPTDLVVEILSHCPDNSATNTELENLLSRLLGRSNYKKWWTNARRLLVKDPRVAVPARKTAPYILRDEPIKAEDEILEAFFETRAPKKKIQLADKLIGLSVKHEDIKEALPDILKALASCLQETKQLNEGERLYGVWIRNNLARFIHEDVESLLPTSASILNNCADLSDLATKIPTSYYKRFLDLIERTFPEDWKKLVIDLLRNSSGRLTTECINYLLERECQELLESTLSRWLNEHTLKGPIIFWILKHRHSRKYQAMLEPLISPRMLNAALYAIDYEALQNAGSRRILLADLLSEDQNLVPELLEGANAETAYDLANNLMLNQGFDDLTKKSVLARFIRLYPGVQDLVGETGSRRQRGLIVSRESFEMRRQEYDHLMNTKIPENKAAITAAREHGDIRENAEYKMARQEQETLLSRKEQLETDLSRAQVTDFSDAPVEVVGIGSVVELEQGSTGQIVTFSILGAWDSDPENNVLSYLTPLANNLISRRAGESVSVEIDGFEEVWKIRDIRRWVDSPVTS